MTNEQALGRALALLAAISSLDGSGEVWESEYDSEDCLTYNTDKFDELVKEIDEFLDSEFRREE